MQLSALRLLVALEAMTVKTSSCSGGLTGDCSSLPRDCSCEWIIHRNLLVWAKGGRGSLEAPEMGIEGRWDSRVSVEVEG